MQQLLIHIAISLNEGTLNKGVQILKSLQDYLNEEAKMSLDDPRLPELLLRIRELRGDKTPPCFGYDDCSTMALSMCPWRMDCGEPS